MRFLLQWVTDNQTLLLALLVFGSRIWSHFEHKATAQELKKTDEKLSTIVNGK